MRDFLQALSKNMKDAHTAESFERAEICATCPEKERRNYADFINSEIQEINGFVCSRCACPLATKIFATDKDNICDKWQK